jgi:hypothetical protein
VFVRDILLPADQLAQYRQCGGRFEARSRVGELAPHLGIRFAASQADQPLLHRRRDRSGVIQEAQCPGPNWRIRMIQQGKGPL